MTSKEPRDFCREMAAIWDAPRGNITESIYSGESVIVPLADVQHIELGNEYGIVVITKHTRWDKETGGWANNIFIHKDEAPAFKAAWCRYRSELEAEILSDLTPSAA